MANVIMGQLPSSVHFEQEDLEMAPFDGKGGLGSMCQLFEVEMESLIDELNEELVA